MEILTRSTKGKDNVDYIRFLSLKVCFNLKTTSFTYFFALVEQLLAEAIGKELSTCMCMPQGVIILVVYFH